MHEALPRRHATHLKRGGMMLTNDEDGRVPHIAAGDDYRLRQSCQPRRPLSPD